MGEEQAWDGRRENKLSCRTGNQKTNFKLIKYELSFIERAESRRCLEEVMDSEARGISTIRRRRGRAWVSEKGREADFFSHIFFIKI